MKAFFSIMIESFFSFVPIVNVWNFLDFSENKIGSKFATKTATERGKYDTQLRRPLLHGKS